MDPASRQNGASSAKQLGTLVEQKTKIAVSKLKGDQTQVGLDVRPVAIQRHDSHGLAGVGGLVSACSEYEPAAHAFCGSTTLHVNLQTAWVGVVD